MKEKDENNEKIIHNIHGCLYHFGSAQRIGTTDKPQMKVIEPFLK